MLPAKWMHILTYCAAWGCHAQTCKQPRSATKAGLHGLACGSKHVLVRVCTCMLCCWVARDSCMQLNRARSQKRRIGRLIINVFLKKKYKNPNVRRIWTCWIVQNSGAYTFLDWFTNSFLCGIYLKSKKVLPALCIFEIWWILSKGL